MPTTTNVPRERLEQYFDTFTKRFLRRESTDVVDVNVMAEDLGDQVAAEGAHLIGITYEPRTDTVELELEGGDLRTYKPTEVWVVEEDDGFLRAIEMVRPDGTREIVRVRRLGVRPRR
jgi:uncharacterized protein DUF5335